MSARLVTIDLLLSLGTGTAGVGTAWLLRRRTMLGARNLYVVGAAGGVLLVAALAAHTWRLALFALPIATPGIAGALTARRWRLSDLGAGEELRRHELARRWIWQRRVLRSWR